MSSPFGRSRPSNARIVPTVLRVWDTPCPMPEKTNALATNSDRVRNPFSLGLRCSARCRAASRSTALRRFTTRRGASRRGRWPGCSRSSWTSSTASRSSRLASGRAGMRFRSRRAGSAWSGSTSRDSWSNLALRKAFETSSSRKARTFHSAHAPSTSPRRTTCFTWSQTGARCSRKSRASRGRCTSP